MKQHIPQVRVVTPAPTEDRPFVPAILTRIAVDGEQWAVIDYAIKGSRDDVQTVTLTFLANVTVAQEP